MDSYLQLKDLSLTYHTKDGEVKALDNISFSVKKNEFVTIVGPSGCGKTTILSLIAGLLKQTSGELLLEGNPIVKGLDTGYMFQKDHLFEWRTIYKNLILGLEIKGKTKDKECLERVDDLLKKYGLYEFKDCYPYQLSGGMRQRAALIRTLSLRPKLLLLDEPFSALDYQTKLNVCDDVHSIITNEKQTVIAVTHDISEAISMSDRIIILTNRPAKVKKIQNIELQDIKTPLKRRESGEFSKYFDLIWRELSNEKKDASEKLFSGT